MHLGLEALSNQKILEGIWYGLLCSWYTLSEAIWGARIGNYNIKPTDSATNYEWKMNNEKWNEIDGIWTRAYPVRVHTANHYTKGECYVIHFRDVTALANGANAGALNFLDTF